MTGRCQLSETAFSDQVRFETAKRGWEAIEANDENKPNAVNIEEFHLYPSAGLSESTHRAEPITNAAYSLDRASMQKVA